VLTSNELLVAVIVVLILAASAVALSWRELFIAFIAGVFAAVLVVAAAIAIIINGDSLINLGCP
jgi:hypothetical protein